MDILARAQFEPKLKERLGKPIVIENRTGGGTVIAATATAKAPPDGYTLFMAPAGTLTTNATLYKKLPYDPAKDFTPIALTSSVAFVLVVHPSLPVHSVKELIAIRQGAARPAGLRLDRHRRDAASRVRDDHARRRAEDDARSLSRHAAGGERRGRQPRADGVRRSGRRAAADQGRQASAARGVVAAAHQRRCRMCRRWRRPGFKGFEAVSWHMIVGPAGMPKEIVDRLNGEFKRISTSPDFKVQVDRMGLIAIDSPPPDELQEISRQGDRELGPAREGRRHRGHGVIAPRRQLRVGVLLALALALGAGAAACRRRTIRPSPSRW